MIRTAWSARILAGLALLALAGCSSRTDVVARVGPEPITVAEFMEAGRNGNPDYPGAPGSGRAMLLNDLIRRKLLVMEARKRHLVPDSMITRLRRETADRYAVEALVQRLVPMPAVSDAEVEAFYQRRAVSVRMRAIYTPDFRAAKDAADQIRRGADFGEYADRLNLPGMVPKGGDLGWLIPGSLVSPLDEVLREAPVGKVIGPLEAPGQGWFVLRVEGRKPRIQDPIEAQRASLREMLRQRKQRELQQRAYVGIRDQYRIRLEPGGSQAMFARFNTNEQNLIRGMGAQPSDPAQHAHDRDVILARYDGPRGEPATYTLANAIADMNAPGRQKPEVTSVPMIDHWIENQVVQKAITTEARRRHLEEEPALAARVEQQIDNMLLQAIYDREIGSRVTTATDAEVRAAYDRHASSFLRLSGAHVLIATTPDSSVAMKLVEAANASGDLRATAKAVGLTAVEREEKFPTRDPVWVEMQAVLLGLFPRQLHGPVKTKEGWMVFQLVSKDQGIQTYEDLPTPFKEQLRTEALEVERDRRLSQLTDSLRTVIPVRVDQARVDHIPWPVPPASPAS